MNTQPERCQHQAIWPIGGLTGALYTSISHGVHRQSTLSSWATLEMFAFASRNTRSCVPMYITTRTGNLGGIDGTVRPMGMVVHVRNTSDCYATRFTPSVAL